MYSGLCPTVSFSERRVKKDALHTPGQSLYGGICFRLTEVRGDWKHHQQVWGLVKAAFTSNNVCHVCKASRTDRNFSMLEFTRQPAFLATTRSHLTFLTEIMGSSGCHLIFVKKFQYSMLRWCSMHAVQLGVGLFLNGGCIYELMQREWFTGNTVADQYRDAYKSFKKFLKEHRIVCSQPAFKPWMYVSSGEESCTFRSKVLREDNILFYDIQPT